MNDLKHAVPDGALVVSYTQISTFRDCPRKWLAKYVWGLKEPKTRNLTVGSAMHACLERYLLAPRGVVPTPQEAPDHKVSPSGAYDLDSPLYGQVPGARIELFPHDWHKVREYDGSVDELTETEAAMVRGMVQDAIDSSAVEHMPNGFVELTYRIPLTKVRDVPVYITGKIDQGSFDTAEVRDHKSMGSWQYAHTDETIINDLQLGTYAQVMLQHLTKAGRTVAGIRVRHNQLKKFNPLKGSASSRTAKGFMTKDRIFAHWADVQELARQMVEAKAANLSLQQNFFTSPCDKTACSKYGGCHLKQFCLTNLHPSSGSPTTTMQPPVPQTSAYPQPVPAPAPQALEAPAAPQAPPAPAPASGPPPVPGAQQAAPEPASAPKDFNTVAAACGGGVPPWAKPNCPVCSGWGLQYPGGAVCPVCERAAADTENSTSNFEFGWKDGAFTLARRAEAAVVEPAPAPAPAPPSSSAPPPQVPPQVTAPAEPPQPEPQVTETGDQDAPIDDATVAALKQTIAELGATGGRGRPKKGFTLLVNAIPHRPGGGKLDVIDLHFVLRGLMATFEREAGMPYLKADTWKRRDWAKSQAEMLANYFGTKFVVCSTKDPEWRGLIDELAAYAATVIFPTQQG